MCVAVTIQELFQEAESGEDHPLTPQWGRLGDLVQRFHDVGLRGDFAPLLLQHLDGLPLVRS